MVEYDRMIEFLNTECDSTSVYPNQTTYAFHRYFSDRLVMVHTRQNVIDIFTNRWKTVKTLKELINFIDSWII